MKGATIKEMFGKMFIFPRKCF